MPSFDYKCSLCNFIFEFKHPMAETMDWNTCPNLEELGCQGYLHKVFRPAATHFKGQGWGKVYRTWKSKGD